MQRNFEASKKIKRKQKTESFLSMERSIGMGPRKLGSTHGVEKESFARNDEMMTAIATMARENGMSAKCRTANACWADVISTHTH